MPMRTIMPLAFTVLCTAAVLEAADGTPPPLEEAPAMERFEVFTSGYAGGKDGFHTIRIPTIVVTAKGTVLAVAEGRKNSGADDGDIDLIMRRSIDGGATWSDIQTIYSFGDRDGVEATTGNPCPIVDHGTGEIVLLFSRDNRTAYRTISTDDGRTWADPVEITETFRRLDYEGLVRVAAGPVHGIQLRDGRLVAPIWVSNMTRPAKERLRREHGKDLDKLFADKEVFRSGVIVSDDHGRTWQPGGLAPATIPWLGEASVFQADDGSLVLNMRGLFAGFRSWSVSRDRGRTWSEPALRKDLPDPTCHGTALKLAHGPLAGAVVFTNLDRVDREVTGTRRRRLTARLSFDDGATWPHARVIEPGKSSYSDLAQLPDGRVLCLFENGTKWPVDRVSLVRFDPAWIRGTSKGEED